MLLGVSGQPAVLVDPGSRKFSNPRITWTPLSQAFLGFASICALRTIQNETRPQCKFGSDFENLVRPQPPRFQLHKLTMGICELTQTGGARTRRLPGCVSDLQTNKVGNATVRTGS